MNLGTLILVALVLWWLLVRKDPGARPVITVPGSGSCVGKGTPGCEQAPSPALAGCSGTHYGCQVSIQAWPGLLGVNPNY